MEWILRAEDLKKNYYVGEEVVRALRGVSIEVVRGEFLVLMGPSGSGKSTLMHILGCLDHPTSGKLYIDGEDVSRVNGNSLAELRNKKIGFVFQQFNLLPRTSALSNVELPLLYAGVSASERKRRALECLEHVGLAHRVNHHPNQLSGGEQQRVAIARALVTNPQVIMADEPTGNLDTKAGGEILAILEGLRERGITIVMVTHEKEVAEHGDRIIYLRDGTIIGEEIPSKGNGEKGSEILTELSVESFIQGEGGE
ncbi:MAG: ABC transporter ATP-binding protein [Actinomycetota bacterium]|nr:ABC transporter ATP-binding protein [Actinomycetota bacterium]